MSRRQKRMQELRASKDRRAKRLAIGGAVVLAALLAFELPHYLGGGSKTSPSAAATTTATAGSTTPAGTATPATTAPGTAAAAVPAVSAASTKLPNSDVAPTRTKSQLSSFSLFAGKDPFVQQVSAEDTTAGSVPAGTAAPTSSAPAPAATSSPVQQTSARTLATRSVATIQVNGKSETVRVGRSFPSANPVFELVSLASGAVNIGIADGSYTSGAQTVRLSSGRSLTLVDTADGVRYKLRLLSTS